VTARFDRAPALAAGASSTTARRDSRPFRALRDSAPSRLLRAAAPAALAASLLAAPGLAQATLALPGEAQDLDRTATGDLLVTTSAGHVIEVTSSGSATWLASPGDLVRPAVASVSLGPGSAAVIDDTGSIYEVGTVPGTPQLLYGDVYLVREPTDLAIDTAGTFWIACKTVSNNTRCIAHASGDGRRWAYYSVEGSPLALASDPVSGGMLLSDGFNGLETLVADGDGAPVRQIVGSATGFTAGRLDGDVAINDAGDVYVAADATVLFHDRSAGTTTTFTTLPGTVRGLALAPASTGGGDSLWIAYGNGSSTLQEVLLGEVAADRVVPAITDVPGTGAQLLTYGLNANCATVDLDGNLLVGGDVFGAAVRIDRIELPSLATSVVADAADGLSSRIEGMHVQADGRIIALAAFGAVHTVDEGPGAPSVAALFSDPLNQITTGKGMAVDRKGDIYIADRQGWAFGLVHRLDASGGFATLLALQDTRGVLGDTLGGRLLANEWRGTGFNGVVGVIDEVSASLDPLVGFDGLNISNQSNVGDGAMVMDASGRIYVSCEDEFAVRAWNPATQRTYRIGSGYLNRATGLAITRSTNPAASSTGFSLYVSQWNRLHEIPGVPPAAPRTVDLEAPGCGELLTWSRPEWGRPIAVAYDDAGARLVAVTDGDAVVELPLDGSPATRLAHTGTGLTGPLTAIATDPSGDLLVGNQDGLVVRLSPGTGYVPTVEFADAADDVVDLLDLVHDPLAGTFLLEAAPDPDGVARLYRLTGGTLELVALPWNGRAMSLDPLAGHLFVSQGATSTSQGELLRVHLDATPALANHWPSTQYTPFDLDDASRGSAIDGDGNVYLASAGTGRVQVIDRATQTAALLAGNYDAPLGLVVAPGRPGIAGANGASLFVIDGYSVFEHGIDADVPPTSIASTLDPDPFMVPALFQFGGGHEFTLESPGDAGRPFIVLPGTNGQLNGYPTALVGGDNGDGRVIAQDFDLFWLEAAANTPPFNTFFGVLDGTGVPQSPIRFNAPNTPSTTGLDLHLDLTWVTLDLMAPNLIGTVGGTAQTFVGL